jgi:hypothetical protein
MSDNALRFESTNNDKFSVFTALLSPINFFLSLTFYISMMTFYMLASKNVWFKRTWLLAKSNFLAMPFFRRIEDLDVLIKEGHTGEPEELSKRLGISMKTLYNFISSMKALGLPITYCKYRQSYYYA